MDNQLGARIAKLRRACGLTQETLGGQLGVSAAAGQQMGDGSSLSKDTTPNITNPRLYDTA